MRARFFIPAAILLLCVCRTKDVEIPDTISISVPYELESLDPHSQYRVGDFALASHFYEPLVRADAESKVRPCLAQSWESRDPQTWIFHLTSAARFHSGKRVSAQDVVYSIRRLMGDPSLRIRTMVSSVSDVTALDPLRVQIRLQRPLSTFLNKLTFVLIIPEGTPSSRLAEREDGTGPYRLVRWVKGQWVDIQRNEEYWGQRPALQRVRLHLGRSPVEARRDLLAGQSQFVQCNDKRLRQTIAWKGDYQVREHESLFVKYLSFDMARETTPFSSATSNPFRSKRVRQAIREAIDRKRLVDSLSVWATPVNQPVPHFVFGFNPEIREPSHHPEEARWLLRSAGYPDGFSVVLHTPQVLSAPSEQISAQLRQIGIKIDVEVLADAQFFDTVNRGDTSFYISGFGCITGDASDVLEDCLHTPDPVGRYGGSNYGRYSNPTLDQAIEASGWATSPQQRRRELQQIMMEAAVDLPWIPLYVDREVWGFHSYLRWRPRDDSAVLAQEIQLVNE
ncbi:MAG: ABC transporter substrate-binding protein [Acidobacteriota bacterium]